MKSTTDQPQINLMPLVGAFISGIAYAFLLSTRAGRRADREHTWFVTVIGVMMTLGWVATEDRDAAWKAFLAFIASGMPMIARALYLQSQQLTDLYERERGHGLQG